MTLRKKTLIIIGATLAGLMVVLYATLKVILLDSFIKLEEQITRRNVERILSALYDELSTLNITTGDYAGWDDTYAFIESEDKGYVEANLVDETFAKLRLNLMLFVNSSGRIVFGKGFDLKKGKELPVPKSLQEHLSDNSPLLRHTATESSITGIILLPEGPMLIASQPILTSEYKGPIRGALIMGRYLDSEEIKRLAEITHLSLTMYQIADIQRIPDFQAAFSSLTDEKPICIRPLGKDSIAGYSVIKDIYGKPGLMLRVDSPRAIYKQGQNSMLYLILSLLTSGLVFGLVILLLLEKAVLSRLTRLTASVSRIGVNCDPSQRVSMTGRDELASLANSINGMLTALEQSQWKLQESEDRYRRLVELSPDAIAVYDYIEDQVVFVNNAGVKLMGAVSDQEIIGKSLTDIVHPDFREIARQRVRDIRKEGKETSLVEGKFIRLDGTDVDVEVASAPITYEGKLAMQVICRDITGRKQMEKKLIYLGLHDSLTGLYNRAYFEEEMCHLDHGRLAPVGIILCDVDGLKLINDTLGHKAGDSLLVVAANLIRESFCEGDVVARIGGDEFAVLLPKSDQIAVENACHRIQETVARYNALNPELPLSISVGFAVSSETSTSITDLFKEADNNMYRKKLCNNQSNRSAIVQALMKALEARDFITEGHADRLQDLMIDMIEATGLPEHKATDLRLLAQFHDIGKVGIPDRILFKTGPLTSEEAAEMQRHCEIGYRIAQSAPDLVPIADWVLKHHERWDGKGYPLGLKEEEIPLECRILAIADAYDAMTSDRPYRKAMSCEEAVAELLRCAGTQFDPQLVLIFVQMLEDRNLHSKVKA
ncbi:MAG: hypothetical protein PWR27_1004 [Petroclostridium sp.]|jgi:diguanylate cyclase (GGDEF)-like protein/PAS domain S-box-containing protein|uniref:CHASE4 domain-containing protein n=1 Tax=Petroclostridium xylanilyticum TaxID=1792311 RepID=UPI000B9953AA|nr:CHASE4 domain-containing protein [Petroclostridium xylanilyticum]MDK2810295.1 hypothetical protein [Petroclostridium sp.]